MVARIGDDEFSFLMKGGNLELSYQTARITSYNVCYTKLLRSRYDEQQPQRPLSERFAKVHIQSLPLVEDRNDNQTIGRDNCDLIHILTFGRLVPETYRMNSPRRGRRVVGKAFRMWRLGYTNSLFSALNSE